MPRGSKTWKRIRKRCCKEKPIEEEPYNPEIAKLFGRGSMNIGNVNVSEFVPCENCGRIFQIPEEGPFWGRLGHPKEYEKDGICVDCHWGASKPANTYVQERY